MQATPEMYQLKIESVAPDFALIGVDNKQYAIHDFTGKEVLVVVFMCNHCPYVLAYIERIKKLANMFAAKEVQFIGINANDPIKYPQDNYENMKRFAKEKMLSFPYLFDETQEVAKAYNALLTPHVFVFDKERKLVYNGGIDDNWQYPEQVIKQYLREALVAITNGNTPKEQETPCIGCSIKWK